jgi:Mg-chelatase subunit ChlD
MSTAHQKYQAGLRKRFVFMTGRLAAWLSAALALVTVACNGAKQPTHAASGAHDASAASSGVAATGGSAASGGDGVDNPGALKDAGPSRRNDAGLADGTCQAADVSASRVIPTVVLVIDQSGSMNDAFGSAGTRWNVLRDFLLKPDGLIASFETQVRFGLSMYSAVQNPDNSGTMQCPIVTGVAPTLKNFAAISDSYQKAMPLAETPTGDAIDKIVAGLPKPALDHDPEPVVLILATDGEPDRCEELNPQHGQDEAVAAVKHAFEMGIRTYIISVGDEVSKQHQQDVANAGLGHDAGDPAPYWQAGDDQALRQALTSIIGAQVSCDLSLRGAVQNGNPCDGTVELNGKRLECKGKDGWQLQDPKHIRLLGQACEDFKTIKSALVHASFPCSVQVVF